MGMQNENNDALLFLTIPSDQDTRDLSHTMLQNVLVRIPPKKKKY